MLWISGAAAQALPVPPVGTSQTSTEHAAERVDPAAETPGASTEDERPRLRLSDSLRYRVDPDTFSLVSTVDGLSMHKPMFLFPLTYSEAFHGDETELLFRISAKQKLFGRNVFFGYTQTSFWQFYNTDESTPFRETVYNPEFFYRWTPSGRNFRGRGLDIGIDHESNGRPFPFSRSWNRLYVAPFQVRGRHLAYLKLWWRIPEGDPATAADQTGDDNPDITDFYGYSEVTLARKLPAQQVVSMMLRGNPRTNRGAMRLTWSIPADRGYVFWAVSLFHGYGESLIDHNLETTRLMVGAMLSR